MVSIWYRYDTVTATVTVLYLLLLKCPQNVHAFGVMIKNGKIYGAIKKKKMVVGVSC